MNRTGLVGRIALANGISEKQAKEAVDMVVDAIITSLRQGERVSIRGFGMFEVRRHKEKAGRNPHTGERILLPARSTVAFKVSQALRKSLDL